MISFATFASIGEPFEDYSIMIINPVTSDPIDVTGEIFLFYIINGLMINLGFSVTAGIIWMVLVAARKELGYYFAKSLYQTTAHEREESKKAVYFIKATKIYDKYLRRTLNLEINDAKRIYSKILADSYLNENESFQLISKSYDSNNKLEPIKTLSKIMNVKETGTFLVDESLGKRIKDMAIFFATIIPVVITIIQFILQRE
jgi:hypothetical protein